jgi:Fe2+ transport system protein B
VQELTNNWNSLFATQKDAYNSAIPSPSTYQNGFGSAYWQWATGQVTQNILSGVTSVAMLFPNVFAGYYEISYFHTDYFNTVAN